MKKLTQILSVALPVVCLLSSVTNALTVPSYQAHSLNEDPKIEPILGELDQNEDLLYNPVDVRTLKDVYETDWFYQDLANLTQLGIIHGCPDQNYFPNRNVTLGEFIKTLVCALSYKEDIDTSSVQYRLLFPENHWANTYAYAAYTHGILTREECRAEMLDSSLTRERMSYYIASALHINPCDILSPFSDEVDIYSLALYREYLLLGRSLSDGLYADSWAFCSRAEICAILSRIVSYLNDPYSYKSKQILNRASSSVLKQDFELWDLFYTANKEIYTELYFSTNIDLDYWIKLYLKESSMYPDIFICTSIKCNYLQGTNQYKLSITYAIDNPSSLKNMQNQCEQIADYIVSQIIRDNMSELEKVSAIHDFIALNCAYDYDNYRAGTIPDSSYRSWGVFFQSKAVCQGYCSAFNMLCRAAGISAHSVAGKCKLSEISDAAHCWSVVNIDGVNYFYDVTFDDPVPDVPNRISHQFFQMNLNTLLNYQYLFDVGDLNPLYFSTPDSKAI